MRSSSPVPIFVGITLAVAGLVAILVGWSRAAATQEVTEQVPLLIVGGLVGLALVMIGLTLVAVQSRRLEGQQHSEQILQVAAAVAALTETLAPTDDDALSLGARSLHAGAPAAPPTPAPVAAPAATPQPEPEPETAPGSEPADDPTEAIAPVPKVRRTVRRVERSARATGDGPSDGAGA